MEDGDGVALAGVVVAAEAAEAEETRRNIEEEAAYLGTGMFSAFTGEV